MWITTNGAPHKRLVNSMRLTSIYVHYSGNHAWSVIGDTEEREYVLSVHGSEKEAQEALGKLEKELD